MFKFTGSVVKILRVLALFSFLAALVVLPHGASAQTPHGGGGTGVLAVNLRDAGHGGDLAGGSVTVWNIGGAIVASGTTDAQGYFKASLAPGVYTVVANMKGYLPSVTTASLPLTGLAKVVVYMTWNTPGTEAGLRGR